MFNKVDINSETDNNLSTTHKINSKKRVDINVLLNRVRADKKKEKLESSIFFWHNLTNCNFSWCNCIFVISCSYFYIF